MAGDVGQLEGSAELARPYQAELFERAKQRNTIVVLGTGSGKTLIALMMMKYFREHDAEHKRQRISVFIVPVVNLVIQQSQYFSTHSSLRVTHYYGDMGVDRWSEADWKAKIDASDVMVMTGDIFKNILRMGQITFKKINLIVVDECHHTRGDHPYNQVMRDYGRCHPEERPRVLGLSASPLMSKNNTQFSIKLIQDNLYADAITLEDVSEIEQFVSRPRELILMYQETWENYQTDTTSELFRFIAEHGGGGSGSPFEQFLQQVQRIHVVMGSWCSARAMEMAVEEAYARCRAKKLGTVLEKDGTGYLPPRMDYLSPFGWEGADNADGDNFECWLVRKLLLELLHIKLKSNFELPVGVKVLFPKPPSPKPADVAPKVKLLIDTILSFRDGMGEMFPMLGSKLCGIIFVDRRLDAKLLSLLLFHNHKLQLRTELLVGHGARKKGGFVIQMSPAQQSAVAKDFKEGRIDLLIATKVAEEGLDIRSCNVVIRYDLFQTVTNYIQSRGRARHKESTFVMFADANDPTQRALIEHIKLAEGEMIRFLEANRAGEAMRSWDDDKEVDEEVHADEDDLTEEDRRGEIIAPPKSLKRVADEPLPDNEGRSKRSKIQDRKHLPLVGTHFANIYSVESTGAFITPRDAPSLLNQYCQLLPRDMNQTASACYKVEQFVGGFRTEILLPAGAPPSCRHYVGEFATTKREATRNASFALIQKLHTLGQLTDRLRPSQPGKVKAETKRAKSKATFDERDSAEEDDEVVFMGEQKTWRTNKPATYPVWVPACWQKSWGFEVKEARADGGGEGAAKPMPQHASPALIFGAADNVQWHIDKIPKVVYLSTIEVAETRWSGETLIETVAPKISAVGMLTSSPMPNPEDLTFDIETGEKVARIIRIRVLGPGVPVELDKASIEYVRMFHELSFKMVLRSGIPIPAEWAHLVVPVKMLAHNKTTIDWDVVNYAVESHLHVPNTNDWRELVKVMQERDLKDFHLVDCAFYYRTFQVLEIFDTPAGEFTSGINAEKFNNLAAFYGKRLMARGVDPTQPALRARKLPHIAQPGSFEEDLENDEVFIIPQFCFAILVPWAVVDAMLIMPLTLQMLHRRLQSLDFLKHAELDIPTPSQMGESYRPRPVVVRNLRRETSLQSTDAALRGRVALTRDFLFWDLDAALTAASASLPFDYELLETLGDSFIKVLLSLHLYARYPNQHEGFLSKMRNVLERNASLMTKAVRNTRIPEFMLVERCSRKQWIPLHVTEGSRKSLSRSRSKSRSSSREKMTPLSDDEVSVEPQPMEVEGTEAETEKRKTIPTKVLTTVTHTVFNKAVADSVEAIIGACLVAGGIKCAANSTCQILNSQYSTDWINYYKSIRHAESNHREGESNESKHPWDESRDHNAVEFVQQIFDYKFRHPRLVSDALTHGSVSLYGVSYQRLEYLGDAVLYFVVTRFLYNKFSHLTPGDLTQLRSELVGNKFLGLLSVLTGLYKQMNHRSESLAESVDTFAEETRRFQNVCMSNYGVRARKHQSHRQQAGGGSEGVVSPETSPHRHEVLQPEQIDTPPKPLADIFEAMLGALFLDSQCDVEAVWKVVKRTMFSGSPWVVLRSRSDAASVCMSSSFDAVNVDALDPEDPDVDISFYLAPFSGMDPTTSHTDDDPLQRIRNTTRCKQMNFK
ncbi:hypothetical protein BJ742DRAFT_838578 [Cladochytrium replicatum]|nr:hypothetical protein BJ742DRAFT_838578 [Cladochytrium replicatum]